MQSMKEEFNRYDLSTLFTTFVFAAVLRKLQGVLVSVSYSPSYQIIPYIRELKFSRLSSSIEATTAINSFQKFRSPQDFT